MTAREHERLGVVVPTLDEAELLPRLLVRLTGSTLEPSDRPDELVVVDGGSRDGTRELAAGAGVRVLCDRPGRGTQLARGAAALSAEWLLFLHADCVPQAGALTRLRAAMATGELEVAAMSQRIEAEGWFYRRVERAADRRVRRRGMLYGDSGLLVRRALYERVGGFGPLPLFEDVDLSRRLRRHARPVLVDAARLDVSARRWQREGALRTTLRNWMIRFAFEAGISVHRLARFYAPQAQAGRTS